MSSIKGKFGRAAIGFLILGVGSFFALTPSPDKFENKLRSSQGMTGQQLSESQQQQAAIMKKIRQDSGLLPKKRLILFDIYHKYFYNFT